MVNPPDVPAPAQSAGAATSTQSPGVLLAAGRVALELTVDEVGDALNLAPHTVHLLEADDFDALPAAAFTQGYIRNYAKYIGLDPDVVVRAYQEKAGKPAVAWESPSTAAGVAELIQRYPGVLITAVVAAVVLLLVIVLALVWPDDDADEVVADPLAVEQGAVEASGAGSRLDNLSETGEAPFNAAPTDTVTRQTSQEPSVGAKRSTDAGRFDAPKTADSGANDRGFDRDAIDPNDPLAHLPLAKTYPAGSAGSASSSRAAPVDNSATAPVRDAGVTSQSSDNYPLTVNSRLTPEGDDLVRLEVSQDCWVAIRSAEGRTLFAVLARPGQTLSLTGAGPFRVKLGYTPGVELFFNDSPVLLEPYTRNGVATLVIGQ